jgi:type III restriction/modification enzyme restriction subunit
VSVRGQPTLAAFIIKGRSSPTVRAEQVGHQILRLARIHGLGLAVLATTGNVLDDVREHLLTMAKSIGCRYAFADVVDLANIFVAYGLICPRDGRKTAAGRCTCGYQYSRDHLNLFQREALRDLARTRERGKPAGVIVLPPGSGKTRVTALDSQRAGANCVLFVAHSREILAAAEMEFVAVYGRSAVKHHRTAKDLQRLGKVNLASIQLVRQAQAARVENVDCLIVDEFHHIAAPSYRQLLQRVKPTFLLGLTATPFREIIKTSSNSVMKTSSLTSILGQE